MNLNTARPLLSCIAGTLALILLSSTASAWQSETLAAKVASKNLQVNKKDTKAAFKKLSGARIAELKAFAKQHHKEVMPLLDFLEKKHPKKFDKVMNGFDRDVSNLEKAKQRSPEAYQTGLAAWINQSRIRLYAAQFKVADDEETAAKLKEKIRTLVTEKVDARIEYLERELDSAQVKVKRLENMVENHKATRYATIEKRIAAVTKQAPDMSKKAKGSTAKEKSAKKDDAEQPAPDGNHQKNDN